MANKIKSARGELVDFDLLKIKDQIASSPPAADVQARQDFIDRRLRRRLKKVTPPAPKIKDKDVVTKELPGTEELSEEPKLIDEVKVEEPKKAPVKKSTSRQKARPKPEPKVDSEPKEAEDVKDTGDS